MNEIESILNESIGSDLKALTETKIELSTLMQIDFAKDEFQAYAKVYIKAGNILSGGSETEGDLAGSAYLLFSPNDFYIHAGYKYYDFKPITPKKIVPKNDRWDPIGIDVNILSGSVNIDKYRGDDVLIVGVDADRRINYVEYY